MGSLWTGKKLVNRVCLLLADVTKTKNRIWKIVSFFMDFKLREVYVVQHH